MEAGEASDRLFSSSAYFALIARHLFCTSMRAATSR
jgi:hypothetical protein